MFTIVPKLLDFGGNNAIAGASAASDPNLENVQRFIRASIIQKAVSNVGAMEWGLRTYHTSVAT